MFKYEYIPSIDDEHGETRHNFGNESTEVRPLLPCDNTEGAGGIPQAGQDTDRDLQVEKMRVIGINWSKELIINELKKFADDNRFSPSAHKIPDSLRGACERHFGTFNEAKKSAELEIYPIGYNLDAKTMEDSWQTRRKIDLTPSPNLVYILGVLKGDGSTYIKQGTKRGFILLKQVKIEFAESFKIALKNLGVQPCISTVKVKNVKGGKIFVTSAGCYPFVQWYRKLTIGNIDTIIGGDKNMASEFIRGFYESEGCNYIRKHSWDIIIVNTNNELVHLVQKLLQELGFHFNVHERKGVYRIENGKKAENLRFIQEIKPCIKNQIPFVDTVKMERGGM